MSSRLHRTTAAGPLLVGAGVAGVAAAIVLAAARLGTSACPGGTPGAPSRIDVEQEPTALEPLARTALRSIPSGTPRSEAEDDRTPAEPSLRPSDSSERDLRDAFLAHERSRPGSLAVEALPILDGPGPLAEKVALLQALHVCGSPASIPCHERAVRLRAEAGDARNAALSDYALGVLCRIGTEDEAARAALARLAFEHDGLAPELRRRAASGLVRCAPGAELARLRVDLRRERDELLIQGVLAVLEDRAEHHAAQALLDALDDLRPARGPNGPGTR